MKIVIGTRGSLLALAQAEEVKKELLKKNSNIDVEIKVIKTKGDLSDTPLTKINATGIFTSTIENELLEGKIDLAVHSMKDMPSMNHEDLMFVGTITPADYRDCLVFKNVHSLDELKPGSIIATGSPRRKSELLRLRPDLQVVDIRGNVDSRLKKLETENIDGLVLAAAGLKRLNREDVIDQYLGVEEMIPACSQGLLGLEIRKDSPFLRVIEDILDPKATERLKLERLFLKTINGNCHLPIGGYLKHNDDSVEFYGLYGNEKETFRVHRIIKDHYEEQIIEVAEELKRKVNE